MVNIDQVNHIAYNAFIKMQHGIIIWYNLFSGKENRITYHDKLNTYQKPLQMVNNVVLVLVKNKNDNGKGNDDEDVQSEIEINKISVLKHISSNIS